MTNTYRAALAANLSAIAAAAAAATTKNSAHIRGMRNLLIAAQDGICAGCGLTLTGARVELCHIVACDYGKGIVPGNVYAGCKECNDYDREVSKGNPAAIVASMARPDLVQTVHPDRAACLAASGNDRAAQVRAARG